MKFTEEQQKVITTRNKNILVSAAAGSGKTAVLVERILERVVNLDALTDIDHILVMTFTKAAAAEMRERIEKALEKRLDEASAEAPDSKLTKHLRRQITLIHSADITTIDSFCTSILRNHFQKINLDPSFRVAEEGELKLLQNDVMEEVLEEAYAEKSEEFLDFIEAFSTKKNDQDVEAAILRLYGFAQSKPFPEEYLKTCHKNYLCDTFEELQQKRPVKLYIENICEEIRELYEEAKLDLEVCLQPDGPYMYEAALQGDLDTFEKLASLTAFEELYCEIFSYQPIRLATKADPSVNTDKRNMVKERRNDRKKRLDDIKKKCFFTSPKQMLLDVKEAGKSVLELCRLTSVFAKHYEEAKRKRNIVDFGDLEHLALRVLYEEDQVTLTAEALEYQDYYEEILVDEYQDSNMVQEYLLQAISRKEEGKQNLFMVGDVKQSIYKFRLAKPELFMDKYEKYDVNAVEKNTGDLRIDLHKNFRSRYEVVKTVNAFFDQLMRKEIGNIKYDTDAALVKGAAYTDEPEEDSPWKSELLLIHPDEAVKDRELEARAVAMRIKELMEEQKVQDAKTLTLRPLKYSDIVILLRTTTGWDDIYKKVLEEQGIPCLITAKTGYFESFEVKTLLEFLTVLDNPRNDIALAAVMKGVLGGFTDEELAVIRAKHKEGAFHEAVLDSFESEKVTAFLAMLKKYRELVPYTPIHELLQILIRDFHFELILRAMDRGEVRLSNLSMLLEKAADYEKTSYQGLFHFVRYIELLKKYDYDYGEAGTGSDLADSVRIMTIHKSKGLEFPVCFLCGTAKKFNQMDLRERLILDAEEGIGIDYVNPKLRVKCATIMKNAMIDYQAGDNLGEELRVLYVAMTRAREKLIMTGIADPEKMKKRFSGKLQSVLYRKEIPLSVSVVRSADSYLNLILPAVMRNQCAKEFLRSLEISENSTLPFYHTDFPLQIRQIGMEDIIKTAVETQVKADLTEVRLKHQMAEVPKQQDLLHTFEERFDWKYPYYQSEQIFTKVSVSELKHAAMEETEAYPLQETEKEEPIPDFLKQKEKVPVRGSVRGTAYHRVMELFDFTKEFESEETAIKEIAMQKAEMVEKGFMTLAESEAVSESDVLKFLNSELGHRMKAAALRGELFREQPFVLGRPAKELKEDYPEDEMILIQGIIDVFFLEDNQVVVADYKTDRVHTSKELLDRYQVQLQYYAKALSQVMDREVKESLIYSFTLGECIWV